MVISKIYGGITVNFHCSEEELKSTNLIYLLKFPNGKYYVGQTNNKFGLANRIRGHCYEGQRGSGWRNIYKNNIIKKYKIFDVFILRRCSLEDIDFFEIFYISILKRKVINLDSGGCKNKTRTKETKEKISKKLREYNLTHSKFKNIKVYDLQGNFIRLHNSIPEVKEYYGTDDITVSNALYKDNRIFLKKYQIFREGTEKIVDYTKRISYDSDRPKRLARNPDEVVYKYDAKTGDLVEEVKIGQMGSDERERLKEAIKRNALYDGFAWSLEKKDSITPPASRYEKISQKLSRPVLQLDDNLNIIKRWENAKEASTFYGDKKSELIREVCIRWRRHSKGFVWCYEDEYEWFKSMWGEKLVRKR